MGIGRLNRGSFPRNTQKCAQPPIGRKVWLLGLTGSEPNTPGIVMPVTEIPSKDPES
jgi:hypothetical protein